MDGYARYSIPNTSGTSTETALESCQASQFGWYPPIGWQHEHSSTDYLIRSAPSTPHTLEQIPKCIHQVIPVADYMPNIVMRSPLASKLT